MADIALPTNYNSNTDSGTANGQLSYHGMTKRLYLQAKVLELMALQLAPFLAEEVGVQPSTRLRNTTIACIYHAREILLQMVGMSDACGGLRLRTLRYGFRELFGTTVFNYLTEQRMKQAEQLLRSGKLSVAEVANLTGYSQPGHFAAAFKRKFGIAPSQCLSGEKIF